MTCSGYGAGHDTWGKHRWARHMAFANLQANVEDHDPSNTNEREATAIKVELVEALVKEGGLNSNLDDATLVSDHDS